MQSLSVLSLEQAAKKLAVSLVEELRLITEWSDKAELISILCDVPPSREQLKKVGKQGVRENLFVSIANKDKAQPRYFCICHGEFTLSSGMDLEHAFPCVKTGYRQKRLLEYLNNSEHNDFADIFLQQSNIKEYLRRDEDGKIKGSGYFYKSCYNAIDNLYLLCHACNIRKKESDPIDWFEKQDGFFGPSFVKEIEKQGGHHQGVLFDRIFAVTGKEDILTWDDGQQIVLRESPSRGIGEFIKEWFSSKFSEVQEGQQIIYDHIVLYARGLFDKIIRSIFDDEEEKKIKKKYRRLIEEIIMLSVYQKSFVGSYLEQTSSGSDDSQGDKLGFEQEIKYVEDMGQKVSISRYSIRKIKGLVKNYYQDKELGLRIKHYCQELRDQESKIDWLQVLAKFSAALEERRSLSKEKWLSEEEIKQKLGELVIEHSVLLKKIAQERKQREEERQQKEEERQQRELAEQRAEQERKQREEERQQKEEERQQRELAEQRAEQERQQKEEEHQQRKLAEQRAEQAEQRLAQVLMEIEQRKSISIDQRDTIPEKRVVSQIETSLLESDDAINDESKQDTTVSSHLFSLFGIGEKREPAADDLDESKAIKKANIS